VPNLSNPSVHIYLINLMSKNRFTIEIQSFDHPTNRQVEIVRLLAVGLTPREIAAKLFLSVKTVETH
jgi:DNA-binding NarL/FixJ family response regulator